MAAYLLKQQGYDVLGMFMINWHDTTGTLAGDCPWNDDLIFAELVARKLGIPLEFRIKPIFGDGTPTVLQINLGIALGGG